MSLSIPRRYLGPAPAGERRVECAYCGLTWMRSDCIRDAAGRLACPDDQDGRDEVTLARLNAEGAEHAPQPSPVVEEW